MNAQVNPASSKLDIAVARRLKINPAEVTQAHRDQLIRLLLDKRGAVPVSCDRGAIPVAPARGPVLTFHPRVSLVTEEGNRVIRKEGQYEAMYVQDAFDKAEVQAIERKQPVPFTPGQRDVGREYCHLFHRCSASGLKLSQIEGGQGGGGCDGVSEAVLGDMQRLRWLQRQIGPGVAKQVRRIRPSARNAGKGGKARPITDAALVRLFCCDAETLSGVLDAHGWSDRKESKDALHRALCAALDRMRG